MESNIEESEIMTYYRVKPKRNGKYGVQQRSFWTLRLWQPILSIETNKILEYDTYKEADDYIDGIMDSEESDECVSCGCSR